MRGQAREVSRWPFRVVSDANVFVAASRKDHQEKAQKDGYPESSCREFLRRWLSQQFSILSTLEILLELVEKLEDLGADRAKVKRLLEFIRDHAEEVRVVTRGPWCDDPDDDKYLAAALDGAASHLVSYDKKVLRARGEFPFRRMRTPGFLKDLREELKERTQAVST